MFSMPLVHVHVLGGFPVEELVISPVEGPCGRPVAHHVEVPEQGLLSLAWGRLQGGLTAAAQRVEKAGPDSSEIQRCGTRDNRHSTESSEQTLKYSSLGFFFIMAKSCIGY